MKNLAKHMPVLILLPMSVFLSSCDISDKGKNYINDIMGDDDHTYQRQMVKAKLDTLEATYKIVQGHGLSNQKFYEIEYMHLRLAKELQSCMNSLVVTDPDDLDGKLWEKVTGGNCGGHPYNHNWVSAYFPYDEGLDYEFTDAVYQFNESIALPTASSNAENIMDGLLK